MASRLPLRPVAARLSSMRCYSTTIPTAHNLSHKHEPEPLPYIDREEALVAELDSGILTLTLNRPEKHHALNRAMLDALCEELSSIDASETSAVVLQSFGKVFSAGHDLGELQELQEDQEQLSDTFQKSSEIMKLLATINQPTIASVQGLATAAGCQLVAACDIVVASPRSSFAIPGATTIGLPCHTPAVELMQCLPSKVVADMVMTGRLLTSAEAVQYGLVSRLSGNPQKEARSIAQALVQQAATGKPTLARLRRGTEVEHSYHLAMQDMIHGLQTQSVRDGINAFLKKKGPKWG